MTGAAEVVARLRTENPEDGYLAYHAPRYTSLLALLPAYLKEGAHVLDIGRSRLSHLIAGQYKVIVDTLGFGADESTAIGRHWRFDLNDAQRREQWRTDIGPYDVIVMAEVIEHLHTSPSLVLGFIRSLLAPGGVLILQTPNAAALHKRLKLLLGRNPYELIREDATNPGHFREYTRSELYAYLRGAGLEPVACIAGNYFDYRYIRHDHDRIESRPHLGAVNLLYRLLPGSFKPGLTLVGRATGTGGEERSA